MAFLKVREFIEEKERKDLCEVIINTDLICKIVRNSTNPYSWPDRRTIIYYTLTFAGNRYLRLEVDETDAQRIFDIIGVSL